MPKTVCLDFDGVLSDYHGWHGPTVLDPPREGVADFLKVLKEAGYQLAIHTTRDSNLIFDWLERHKLDGYFNAIEVPDGQKQTSYVFREKPPAFVYVDDRAILFRGDYAATIAEIASFKAYWEKNEC